MPYDSTRDRYAGTTATRDGPGTEAVGLAFADVSDTDDLAVYAKAWRVYNGTASAVTFKVLPTRNVDAAPILFTVQAGASELVPFGVRRFFSTGSVGLISAGAIASGLEVTLYR